MATLTSRQVAHTRRIGLLLSYAFMSNIEVKVIEWNRLLSTQKEYVAKGVSKTLASRHLDNLATDIYIVDNGSAVFCNPDTPEGLRGKYRALGNFWESHGGRWGGRFIDREAFKKKHGRDFDPLTDIGWDPYHFESA